MGLTTITSTPILTFIINSLKSLIHVLTLLVCNDFSLQFPRRPAKARLKWKKEIEQNTVLSQCVNPGNSEIHFSYLILEISQEIKMDLHAEAITSGLSFIWQNLHSLHIAYCPRQYIKKKTQIFLHWMCHGFKDSSVSNSEVLHPQSDLLTHSLRYTESYISGVINTSLGSQLEDHTFCRPPTHFN